MELSRLGARVFVYVLERVRASPRGEVHHFTLDGEAEERPVAVSRIAADPGVAVVFTLPERGRRVLLTLAGEEPGRVAGILARLDARADVGFGAAAALPLDDPWLAERGRVGVALLPPSAAPSFQDVSDFLRFDDDVLEAKVVVFLDREELELAERLGVAALAERIRLMGRNLARLATGPRR